MSGAATWRVNGRVPVQALRIELPERLAANLTTIETIVGSHEILYHQRRPGAWNSRVLGNTHGTREHPVVVAGQVQTGCVQATHELGRRSNVCRRPGQEYRDRTGDPGAAGGDTRDAGFIRRAEEPAAD